MFFITAIISREHLRPEVPRFEKLRSRTFGYYPTFDEAHAAVTDNVGSMCESLYDYIVIEKIGPGVHACSEQETWYKWHDNLNYWEQITQKPVEFLGITNWAIG